MALLLNIVTKLMGNHMFVVKDDLDNGVTRDSIKYR